MANQSPIAPHFSSSSSRASGVFEGPSSTQSLAEKRQLVRAHRVASSVTDTEPLEGLDSIAGENATPSDNEVNALKLERLKERFEEGLLRALSESAFEFGYATVADKFIRDQLNWNRLVTMNWISGVFVDQFANSSIVVGLLRTLAHFDYNTVAPQGTIIAIAALTHSNPEVCEAAVRLFESWENVSYVHVLQNVRVPDEWLQEYIDSVARDLLELSSDAVSRAQDRSCEVASE